MPRISLFHGIAISMFHSEHGPPHIHAAYGECKAVVGLDPVGIEVLLRCRLTHFPTAQRFVHVMGWEARPPGRAGNTPNGS